MKRLGFLVAASFIAATPVHALSAASELLHLWDDANDRCRDGRGSEALAGAACDERERYSARLDELGFCFGHLGEVGAEKYWHRCDARSIRPERSTPTAAATCIVNDPTPTPLNYRTAPYGRVLGILANGHRVMVIDRARDQNGKAWVYVAEQDKTPIGWVFREYVDCF